MRIVSGQYQSMINVALQANQERINFLTQQIATGKRIQLPSDDPVDNVRISRLNNEEAMIGQYQKNIASVQTRLLKNENYLSSMITDMGQVRDQLVWASNGTNAPDDLNAMTASLRSMRDSVFYTANQKDQEGRYMFSGTATDTPALSYDPTRPVGSRYTYTGNTDTQVVVVGNGITQAANVDVSQLEVWLNKIDSAVTTLSAPGVNANDPAVRSVLTAALNGTDDGRDLLSSKVAIFGGAQNILTTLNNNLDNVSLSNQLTLRDLSATNLAEASMDLSGYQTALQATYKAYAKVGNLSLFDVL
ncbi:flagellar hook-associated protein FlgL [Janthinobacterium agaricidamnosum]|uniref:Flagellar hook-associated protein 3 n=1 Tax=Janthinobacterium agaricidamnosum NBRC 102515 = DSM 9628 TaxID=1349767 RepID=W0V5B3_9BURK|nr:flagellar hook-associated protein FlgL [Janthinobacterium agaricidamnosum]CDG82538.1 flagellar hook-associated protein 3 [Janthinobacterium agaricidamnosum NBRC 102515 = DSM 9628]